jgi:uncharacterized protein
LINDLDSVPVLPLSADESHQLIQNVLKNYGYRIERKPSEYLLSKIEWMIPFHIQLALKEIMDLQPAEKEIDEASIDRAFNEIIDYRNNNYFDHYYKRLRKHLSPAEFKFAEELLCELSKTGTIHSNTIHNLAAKRKLETTYKSVTGALMYDGYINNNDTPEIYRFNSPILKMWWNKYVCN